MMLHLIYTLLGFMAGIIVMGILQSNKEYSQSSDEFSSEEGMCCNNNCNQGRDCPERN